MNKHLLPNATLGAGREIHALVPLKLRTYCGLSLLNAATVSRTAKPATCSVCCAEMANREASESEQQTEAAL